MNFLSISFVFLFTFCYFLFLFTICYFLFLFTDRYFRVHLLSLWNFIRVSTFFSAMFAGNNNIPSFKPIPCIISRDQKRVAVPANPAFYFSWNTHPVSHRNISDQLYIASTPFRMFWKFFLCKLKKAPHTLGGNTMYQVFLLFSGYFRHWRFNPADLKIKNIGLSIGLRIHPG